MGQILYGCTRTTEAVRRAIQNSQESIMALAPKYAINPKTVIKWRKGKTVKDALRGPGDPSSTVLPTTEDILIVAFRKHTLLTFDECLYALQAFIPKLTRSSLHRCLQRHGISRLSGCEGGKRVKKKFKTYPIGFFHTDIAEVRSEEGKLHLFVAIDRTLKFVMTKLTLKATMAGIKTFLEELIHTVPYTLHTILTDDDIHCGDTTENRCGPTAMLRGHSFDRVCRKHGVEHRLSKPNHPWTNGQVERMNRTLKEAPVNRYFYQTHAHLNVFVNVYNFAKRLKTLQGLTPYEFIVRTWTEKPEPFFIEPNHLTSGLYT